MGPANDESNYHATPKRTYLFTILAEATFMLIWLAYFTCVSNEYCDLMNEKYDREQREVDRVQKEKDAAKKKKDDEDAEKKRKEKEESRKNGNSS